MPPRARCGIPDPCGVPINRFDIHGPMNHPRLLAHACALVLACAPAPSAAASVVAGPLRNPATGHWYCLLAEASWQDSEAEAVGLGGHLVKVDDAAEQAWVFDTFGQWGGVARSLWIGLNDAADEGRFVWRDLTAPAYTHWLPGQPDNSSVTGGESYVHMLNTGNAYGHPGGFWNDLASPNSVFTVFNPVCGVVEIVAPTVSVRTHPFQVCWQTAEGARYQVQSAADPVSGPWETVIPSVAGTGAQACADARDAGVATRFYRVVLLAD